MTEWLDDNQQHVWRLYLDVNRMMIDKLDDGLSQRNDLALTDYEILVMLSEADERRLRMSELAQRVLVSRSKLTYRIDQLTRRGFVCREQSEDDGRGMFAVLTPAGFSLLEASAPGHVTDVNTFLFDHLDDDDLATLQAILERTRAKLG